MDYLETITGEIEAIGQSEFNKQGYTYAYIRFADDYGNVVMKKNVWVGNTVNSYLSPGVQGSFHVSNITDSRSIIFAYDNETRKVYDKAEMKATSSGSRGGAIFYFGAIVVSLMTVIGWLWFAIFIKPMFLSYRIGTRTKPYNLEKYLSQFGYLV